MDKLLMIADDLTGALDSSVSFAGAGISTCVCLDNAFGESQPLPDCSVLVCVAETRHISSELAYRAVYRIVAAAEKLGFSRIYKKTDSALRGNIGAELSAARDAAGTQRVYFVPAYPQMNRITREGVQYIDGDIPVSQSVFAADPFNPVHYSAVLDILAETAPGPAFLADVGMDAMPEGIAVFNAETQEDIYRTANWIVKHPDAKILAGCAGLASVLPRILDLERRTSPEPLPGGNLMVFCGSVNPISLAQCQAAIDGGAPFYHLMKDGNMEDPEELARQIADSAKTAPITVFDTGSTNAEVNGMAHRGRSVSQSIGRIIQRAAEQNPEAIPVIIGGDTLLEFLRQRNIETIYPLRELYPGVVLAKYLHNGRLCHLISKSGGFGERELLVKLRRKLGMNYGEDSMGGV